MRIETNSDHTNQFGGRARDHHGEYAANDPLALEDFQVRRAALAVLRTARVVTADSAWWRSWKGEAARGACWH